jgi:multidrug efflux pump subunit AcrA (membrane-fusion protein)
MFVLVMLCPMRYRIACECELQPVNRRFVAAPFDGRLEKNFVEPGDVVAAGDVLASIDPRDVNWELSGKLAELHRVTKERAGYLVAHESGKVEMASLEMERLGLDIEQLEHHAANLEIRSPIAGIVVLGDLSKSEGVPLEKGQSLFEIAPLDRMVVEVSIPEDDVRFVEKGMPARVNLDAFPMNKREAAIERIHPRAELQDHENVFVAEVTVENTDGVLRPGMRGHAKIATVRRTVGWVFFHKAIAATLTWFGW